MAQDLYYISGSQLLTIVYDNGNIIEWSGVSTLEISGSGYDAPISGSEFIGTVGTTRIYAYSGSTLLVSFPLDNTNIYYKFPFLSENSFTGSFTSLDYSSISDDSSITGSNFSIYDLNASSSFISLNQTASGLFNILAGNSYLFSITESNGNTAYLYFNDVTSGSNILTLSASSEIVSSSYTPIAFHDYQVTFSVIVPAP